jgi:hypothetical protein
MTNDPVDLDARRGPKDQNETDIRRQSLHRRLEEFQAEVTALQYRR